jgi:hypothetical protein
MPPRPTANLVVLHGWPSHKPRDSRGACGIRSYTYAEHVLSLHRSSVRPALSDLSVDQNDAQPMHTISQFNQLGLPEKANLLSSSGALIVTEVHQYTRTTYYIYSNFFVEVIYPNPDGDPLYIDAFRTGPRVQRILSILEASDGTKSLGSMSTSDRGQDVSN